MKTLVILISGRGSNMQALLEAQLPADRIVVVSSNPDAEGLKIAAALGIQTATVDHRVFSDRETFDAALAEEIDHYRPELIALAGFMRILTSDFVLRYQGRLMNIHPSLLPAFPGLHTHRRALQEGVKIHGCTVHFVTPVLDHGPIVIQAAIPILANDTCQTLAKRVLQQEHRIYPQAVRWFMHGSIRLSDNTVTVSETSAHDFVIFSPGLQE
ncbi:MAG TPA: phosphoribosylglycinamide formyltransferase [Nitrosomonas sp.]|uniref:phosphoribosylglycinamide formyltransferase n=1 Tax=Nitrosomonas sp. TaxID=42353 RepID=UPI000E9D4D7B|nr:phosphoribosylglycinamide formyltransferase [Nitrosomonas sp.]GJL75424.1 MAG: phosphoribosylglycinamide formyltransferase [Nitrosomonas sp.]HBV21761.1 phosphoribosylglycinamide formyltransferase [Nitrosomonas sp.]HNP26079.1 phosphoribosylglycinamide formyltransferase [Nitrosomonas sp.]